MFDLQTVEDRVAQKSRSATNNRKCSAMTLEGRNILSLDRDLMRNCLGIAVVIATFRVVVRWQHDRCFIPNTARL